MDTPNGHMQFLQAVALTEDEMYGMMCWMGDKFLTLMEKSIPLCVTDLFRDSILNDRSVREQWQTGIEEDGSSTAFLYVDEVHFKQAKFALDGRKGTIQLGAGHTETIATMLRARIGKKRELYLQSKDMVISFKYDEKAGFGMEDDFMVILLNEAALQELCEVLQPHARIIKLRNLPLTLELVPTYIRDAEGNVLEVIK